MSVYFYAFRNEIDAGPVPDVLVGACQGVKERGFPAVGVARQGDGNVAHEWFPCLDIWVPVLLSSQETCGNRGGINGYGCSPLPICEWRVRTRGQ